MRPVYPGPCIRVFVFLCVALFPSLFPGIAHAQTNVALLGVFNMTTSSTGEVTSGPNSGKHYDQSSRSSVGASAEFEHCWGKNGLVLAFTRTPTNSTLTSPGEPSAVRWVAVAPNTVVISSTGDVKWKITRNEFNFLYARSFRGNARFSPRIFAGLTSILLDGGQASGFDHQFAPAVGASNDLRLSSRLAFRCEFLANFLRASNYSDGTYAASHTVMLETRAGLRWTLISPKHH